MKKFVWILLFLFIPILFTGCTKKLELDISDAPAMIEFDGENPGLIKIIYPMSQYSHPDDGFVLQWQSYMLDKYDLDIELKYTKEYLSYDVENRGVEYSGVDVEDIKPYINDGGFIYIMNTENITKLIDSGLVVPVNDYVHMTPSLAVLDDGIFKPFSDNDGNIWAIPMTDVYSVSFTRFYIREWIKAWDGKIPETIDELYDYAVFVRDGDPDSNGEDDTFFQMVNKNYIFSDLGDIFKAYGCYADGRTPIVFNPQRGVYEDVLLTEEFRQAIIQILNMKNEGMLLFSEKNSWEWDDFPYKIASVSGASPEYLQGEEDIVAGFYLLGPNKTDLVKTAVPGYCMMVLADTEKVPEKLEYLLRKVKDNPDCVMDMQCGIKDISYKEYADFYAYFYRTADQESVPRIGIFTYYEEEANKPIVSAILEADLDPDQRISSTRLWDDIRPYSYAARDSEYAYTTSYLLQNNAIDLLNRQLRSKQLKLITEILDETSTVDEAIEQYRFDTQEMNIPEAIADFNVVFD